MTFMEELEVARIQGFTRDIKDGWEARVDAAYNEVRSYLLTQAADIVRLRIPQNDTPIKFWGPGVPISLNTLGNKETALLIERLKKDGLKVEPVSHDMVLSFEVSLPVLPAYFSIKNA